MFTKSKYLAVVPSNANKYTRGVVGVCAGSEKFPGAAVLCVGGARRGGAGYVKFFAGSKSLSKLVTNNFPDVVTIDDFHDQKIDAIVVGPGNPKPIDIPSEIPLVLDSSSIAFVDVKRNPITVLTPHEGELKYLGYTLKSRNETAQRIANELGAILVLKGEASIVAAPNLSPLIDELGGVELSTAGSGDLLAGLIGSMLASWKPKSIAEAQKVVFKAVQMHSAAGKLARKRNNPVVATDILEALGQVSL